MARKNKKSGTSSGEGDAMSVKQVKKSKKRRGDRRDGRLVREADSMHKFAGFLLPNRCDNEAVMSELVDMTAVEDLVKKKNADSPDFKYTMFHIICAAVAKVLYDRPKMNYFYAGNRLYERNEISFSFVVKRQFVDSSSEALAIIKLDKESDASPLEQVYGKVKKFVTHVRGENKTDGTTDIISVLVKSPRPIMKFIISVLNFLENRDWLPRDLVEFDPYHSSVFISNTGSIGLSAQYHHLTNWGTNSFFILVGEKHLHPFYDENGNVTMKNALELGLTIDERIADGVYFAKSIKLLRKLLQNPELLELPLQTEIEFE